MGSKVKIEIDKERFFENAFRLSSYEGRAVDDNGNPIYDEVFLAEQDKALLDGYFEDARRLLVTEFAELVGEGTDESSICLELPARFNMKLIESVVSDTEAFVVKYALSKWFFQRDKGVAERFAAEAKSHSDDMRNNIYVKDGPEAREDWPKLQDSAGDYPKDGPEAKKDWPAL